MKKTFLCAIFSTLALLSFIQSAPLEARHHHRSSHVQVGVGVNTRDTYVARRYVRPVIARPVIIAQDRYCAPVYMYEAPVCITPAYVEEVHVTPRSRPLTFGGLSFSFNLFK